MSRDARVSLILVGLVFLLMNCTSCWIPLCWDEGDARFRARKIAEWVDDCSLKSGTELFSCESMADKWRFVSYKEGHPAFYGIVAAASEYGIPAFMRRLGVPVKGEPRTGFLLFYAAAVGAVYYRVRKIRPDDPLAAWGACFALVFMPRLYCLAHFSVNDSILISCWLLTWASFASEFPASANRWFIPPLWGAFLGLTCASKFTGFCAIPCFSVAILVCPRRNTFVYLAKGFVTAAIVFYLVNPNLWLDPVAGLTEFFSRNLGREETFNLTGYFFGNRYNMTYGLPFWNTAVWVLITIPTGILICLCFGLRRLWLDRRLFYAPILAANAVVLLIVRALPHAPTHDNDRLIIAAFAFLAVIAGLGAAEIWNLRIADKALVWLRTNLPSRRQTKLQAKRQADQADQADQAFGASVCRSSSSWATATVLAAVLLGTLSSWIFYAPSWLSYYNLLIGGLPGAYAAGMEPTYWWTDLDGKTLNWINENTPPGEKVRFAPCSYYNLNLLIREGKLKRNYYPDSAGEYRWYVMQNRPSVFRESDWRLLKSRKPAFVKSIPLAGPGPWNLKSVPLLLIYDEKDFCTDSILLPLDFFRKEE